jgi:threonine dehydratase
MGIDMASGHAQTVERSAIEATHRRIARYIRRTPTLEVNAADFGLEPARLSFKLELLQHAGSFKSRGAFANLLLREVPKVGVAAASGGNHGAAVAFAAKTLGIPAKIFVPRVSSAAKVQLIRDCGADLVVGGDLYADALAACEAWIAHSGALSVHAFDQYETLLGQGTLGLELEQQIPDASSVLIGVGGGGLIGGVAAWYANRVRVVGVEPDTAPTLTTALAAGGPADSAAGGIAADSLAPKRIGERVYPIAAKYVESVLLVADEDIRRAQQALWTRLRIVAEPGGAAAFAAVLSGRYRPAAGEHVVVVISGGNTTAVSFGS